MKKSSDDAGNPAYQNVRNGLRSASEKSSEARSIYSVRLGPGTFW